MTTLGASGTTTCGTPAITASSKLSAFAATTSAELAGVISDETGSGALVFGTDPVFTTGIGVGIGAVARRYVNTTIGALGILLFDDGTNYEGATFTSTAGAVTLAAVTAGTGTDNINLVLTPAGTGYVYAAGPIYSTGDGGCLVDGGCNVGSATTARPNYVYAKIDMTATRNVIAGNAIVAGLAATHDRISVVPVAKGANQFDGTITLADLTAAQTWTFPNLTGQVALVGVGIQNGAAFDATAFSVAGAAGVDCTSAANVTVAKGIVTACTAPVATPDQLLAMIAAQSERIAYLESTIALKARPFVQ